MRYLPRFIEVWVTASLDEYRLRDAKRLYAQFAGGDVRGMPGEHAIYEAPELAEVTQGRATRRPPANRRILGSNQLAEKLSNRTARFLLCMDNMSFERILVATDFSEGSQQALEYALRLAEKFGSELTLVHSWEAPNYAYATDLYLSVDVMASIEKAAVARLEQATTELKARFPGAKSLLRTGPPWQQVLGAATEVKADLIVMGTHGRRGLERALLGSVAERVVRMSHVPVLTVHGAKE